MGSRTMTATGRRVPRYTQNGEKINVRCEMGTIRVAQRSKNCKRVPRQDEARRVHLKDALRRGHYHRTWRMRERTPRGPTRPRRLLPGRSGGGTQKVSPERRRGSRAKANHALYCSTDPCILPAGLDPAFSAADTATVGDGTVRGVVRASTHSTSAKTYQ